MNSDRLFTRFAIGINAAWLTLFALVPIILILIVSFLKPDPNFFVLMHFSPRSYLTLINPIYLKVFARSLLLALITAGCCLCIGYPFAFILAQLKTRFKPLLLLLVIIPFWTSSLLRSYAMVILLEAHGILNSFLLRWHIISQPLHLLYTNTAVLIGLVYCLLPFMILPLYANIEKLDLRLIEAARDLGASHLQAFGKVIIPLTLPGIISGTVLVLLPAMTLFYIPDLLGGAKSLLLGNLIQMQFLYTGNWPQGSAVSIALTVLMSLLLLLYLRLIPKAQRSQPL